MLKEGFIIDGVRWIIGQHPPRAIPLCPKDYLEVDSYPPSSFPEMNRQLKCEKCRSIYSLPRTFYKEQMYVLREINSKTYKKMKFINLDDEALPVAEDKISKNSEYFVTSLLTKSKVGLRLIVYAGKKGSDKKTQVFVEPDIKRLAFDQTNLHPTDVFTKLEATFSDGSKASQKKKK